MKRYIVRLLLVILLVTGGAYGYGLYQNNKTVDAVPKAQLKKALERSIVWLEAHRQSILVQSNPMIWWKLKEAHDLNHDPRLASLLKQYQQTSRRALQGAWAPLFHGPANPYLNGSDVQGMPYYNQHLIYALNCAADIANDLPSVEAQNEEGFCFQASYFYRPACVTRQLMGLNFLYAQKCGFQPDLDTRMQALQQSIVNQLVWDIRVIDVYLQRVMMLLITGAEDSVKPIWIQRVVNQQLGDGGWSGFQELIPLSERGGLGFSGRFISFGREASDFHATAQGVLLLSYLLQP